MLVKAAAEMLVHFETAQRNVIVEAEAA